MPLPYDHLSSSSLSWINKHQSLINSLVFNVPKPLADLLDSDYLSTNKLISEKVVQPPRKDTSAGSNAMAEGSTKLRSLLVANTADNTKYEASQVNDGKKRELVDCNLEKATLNMLVDYLRTGRMCGSRALKVRFGLGWTLPETELRCWLPAKLLSLLLLHTLIQKLF